MRFNTKCFLLHFYNLRNLRSVPYYIAHKNVIMQCKINLKEEEDSLLIAPCIIITL